MMKLLLLAAALGSCTVMMCAPAAYADTTQYTYDALGRVIKVVTPSGLTTTYTYDAAGNRTQVTTG